MSAKPLERRCADSESHIKNNPVEVKFLDRVIFSPFLPDFRCPTQIYATTVQCSHIQELWS